MTMYTWVYLQLYVYIFIYITLTSMSLLPSEINSISLHLIIITKNRAFSGSAR